MTTMQWSRFALTGVVLGALGVMAACTDESAPVPIVAISVTPATMTIYPGTTVPLQATARDEAGTVLQRPVTWTSERPGVASVNADGVVTAIAAGETAIIASREGVTGAAMVTVLAPVNTIVLAPPTATLLTTQSVQLTVTLRDAIGGRVERPVTWTSGAPSVATVSASGLVTALTPGTAVISAESEGKSAQATVTVLAPVTAVRVDPIAPFTLIGKTLQLTALITDADGNALTRPVVWASSNPGVATIDANGLVSGLSPGVATITATSAGVVGAANLTVLTPVATLIQTPTTAAIATSEKIQLIATLFDADARPLVRQVTWTTDDAAVATVDAKGMVTAVAPGVAHITGTVDALTASSTITVHVPAASLVISPASVTLAPASSATLVAVARDGSGAVLDRMVSWSSTAPTIATVSAGGVVTAVASGTASIVAAVDFRADTASVTVYEPAASIAVTPPTDSLSVGETIVYVAQTFGRNGNIVRRPVTWTSSNPSVATVASSGKVTGIAIGVTTIRARSDGAYASKAVTVVAPVASVELTAPSTTVGAGQTINVGATPRDAAGGALNRTISWSSSNPSVATVSQSGVVTGVAPGSATISASAGGKSGSVTVTVVPAGQRVVVTASGTMVTPETPSVSVTAVVYDAQNNVIDRPVTWTSSDPSVLTVVATGPRTATVTRVAAGSATITASADGVTGAVAIEAKGGSSGGETETANNLSWPTIFADGLTIAGVDVGTDAGLRPFVEEGITVGALPFWYPLNTRDWLNTYYLQGGENTWRADWRAGGGESYSATVDWGDNLTQHSYNTHSTIHIEVALYARGQPTMQGFNMFSLAGTGPDEVQGTDGTVGSFTPMLYSVHPRLVIQKLDAQGGNPQFTIVDQKVADAFGNDGPGYYRGELNKAGKIVYGYNLLIKDIVVPDGAAKYGWYRLNFILEDGVTVGGVSISRHVSLDGLASGDETEEPLYVPMLDANGKRSYLDIYISSASGGHE